jgi:hypothetical protein
MHGPPPQIRFFEGRGVSPQHRPEGNRGWRLAAYLLWQHHNDLLDPRPSGEPSRTPRTRLRTLLSVAAERPAIKDLRDLILMPAGALDLLSETDGGLALREAELLSCDLAHALAAVRAGDRRAAREAFPDADAAAVARFRDNLMRTKNPVTAEMANWVDALVNEVARVVLSTDDLRGRSQLDPVT